VIEFLLALVPSAGVLLLFWLVVKGFVEADRRERLAQARLEASREAADPPTVRDHT
jgi:hypothetical protein